MSLAKVTIPSLTFAQLLGHLLSKPLYRNMHMREPRQRNGKRELRYLHAMHASVERPEEIDGMISGPDVYWHYKLKKTSSGVQPNVLHERGSAKDIARMGERFLREIVARMRQEQAGTQDGFPRRKAGQFYLRRRAPGMSSTHPSCSRATGAGVLDRRFVSMLEVWNFELLCP